MGPKKGPIDSDKECPMDATVFTLVFQALRESFAVALCQRKADLSRILEDQVSEATTTTWSKSMGKEDP